MTSFFRTQKLLIQVLPAADDAPQRLRARDNCDCWWTPISPLASATDAPLLPPRGDSGEFDPSDPASLLTLKAQLKEALALVEAEEQALNEKLRPQTLEEAQALETFLTNALAEVSKQKEALQNKPVEDTEDPNG
jgi:hypothetical protein